jgi:hypothetical protein
MRPSGSVMAGTGGASLNRAIARSSTEPSRSVSALASNPSQPTAAMRLAKSSDCDAWTSNLRHAQSSAEIAWFALSCVEIVIMPNAKWVCRRQVAQQTLVPHGDAAERKGWLASRVAGEPIRKGL